jgi:protein-disulfide isomerase
VFPQVEKDVVDSGKARYVAFNFPLDNIHPLARKAAVAVNCAGRAGRYWEMHARLFEISPNLTLPQLVAQGAALGLEPRAWGQCLQDSRGTRVDKDLAVGHRLGVTGTPTFFVGVVDTGGGISLKKRMVGAATPKVLAQVVADVREGTSLIARLEHLVGFTP